MFGGNNKGLKELKAEAGLLTGTQKTVDFNGFLNDLKEGMKKNPDGIPRKDEINVLKQRASDKLKENDTPRTKGSSVRPIGGW